MSKKYITDVIKIDGQLLDGNGSAGTSGQVLSSTGTATDWVSLSEISGVDGSGNENYVAKWADGDSITNSIIYDNGTNVGIGTPSPGYPLDIAGFANSSSGFRVTDGTIDNRISWSSGNVGFFGTISNHPIAFNTNLTERIRITSGGNVGIGTTTPGYKLDVNGDVNIEGTTYGLYHSTKEDEYYFDDYNGSKYLSLFYKNAYADILRYQPIDNLEYWDGSAWQDMSSQASNVKRLLDGRKDTNWYVPSTYYKFRFTTNLSTAWPTRAMVWLETSWTGSTYPGGTVTIEEDVSGTWTTRITADFNSGNGVTTWGLMARADSALHTGNGAAANSTRITVDFYGWTPSNPSYVTLPLQNIMITSQFSGSANTDYSALLDYDKTLTTPGKLYITTTDTNTSSTTALVLNGSEVEKRTLGSNAFNSTDFWHAGNDGSGSGLDADLLDGVQGSSFLRSDADDTTTGILTFARAASGTLAARTGWSDFLGYNSNYGSYIGGGPGNTSRYLYSGGYFYDGTTPQTLWHTGNDGSGSGLDADLLDGNHASAFALSSHTHDDRYYTETESDSRFVNVSGDTMTGTLNIGAASTDGAGIHLIYSTTVPEIRIQAGENGASAFSIYNTATSPDSEQFFINNTLSASHLGNARGALKLETSSGVVLTLSGTATILAGDLTVSGGDIILSGTGRIQGIDTVSANTDAANKLYVDNAVAGVSYTHPTHPGDDINLDTGALTGATVISDLDFNITTDTLGHVTDANATYSTRNLTASDIGAAASSHTHSASDITSGTLDSARIPSPTNGDWWNNGYVKVLTDGVMEGGKYFDMHATDTATSDYDVRLTASTGSLAISGDLVVSGGDITLSGTGRIQGIDTVSVDTDAANKLYVDNAIAGVGGVGGSGTTNFIPKFTASSTIGNSQIKDDGTYVGVGTTNPLKKLHVVETNTAVQDVAEFKSLSTTRAYIAIRDANTNTLDDFVRVGAVGDDLTLWAGNSEAIRINSSQQVGIGVPNPSYKLEVLSTGTIAARFATGTDDTKLVISDNDTTGYIGVKDNQVYVGTDSSGTSYDNLRISASGNVGIGQRLFHNGDVSTYVEFETDQITLSAANVNITDTLSYTYPTATGQYKGEIVTFGTFYTTNGTIAAGDVIVYTQAGVNTGWFRASGNTTYGQGMLGIAMGTTPSDGILVKGFARNAAFTSGNGGDPLYISASSAGDTTSTPPGSTNNVVRIVGYMLNPTNDEIFFDPDKSWVRVS